MNEATLARRQAAAVARRGGFLHCRYLRIAVSLQETGSTNMMRVLAREYGGRNRRSKVDRISSLPDELLSLILSFLPTKCAVGTSILSNRWKYLWTYVTSFDFNASPEQESNPVDFTDLVDSVFRNCNLSHIQRFRLHFRSIRANHSHIAAWINEATTRMVSELDINVHKLPLSIFSCRTLTVLKLAAVEGYGKNIPSFYLPCLKVLLIEWKWPPKGFMDQIFGSCPVLEDLTLNGSLGYDNKDEFMVLPPTLKTLRLDLRPCLLLHGHPRKIIMDAPHLKYLYLSGDFIKYNIRGDFSSLVKANLNVGKFCKGPGNLGFQVGTTSLFPSPSGIDTTLAKVRNLTCLEVVICDHRFLALIPELMKGSPSLEVLSLEQKGSILQLRQRENTWVEPKSMPNCLRSHLAVIKIKGFNGGKHDLELLKYFLGNGKVLQRLSISQRRLPLLQEVRFREELLKFSRASVSCQIHFHENDYPYKSL